MMRLLTIGIVVALLAGCAHTPAHSPILSGRPVAISALPDVVRETVESAHPKCVFLCASVIEVDPHPDSHLVKIRPQDGSIRLLEVSSEGHIGKEITEHPPGHVR